MPKIKIVISDSYYYDEEYHHKVVEGISDWEEVTEEDYQFIKNNLHHLNIKKGYPSIIRQDDVSVYERIKDIKGTLAKYQKEFEAKREEEKRKREEAAERRRAKKLARDAAALERLVKENPELVKKLVVTND